MLNIFEFSKVTQFYDIHLSRNVSFIEMYYLGLFLNRVITY